MALDVQTNILNGQQTAVGTGGFDLRQILGVNNLETVPSALDTTSTLTSSTTSAPSFDAQQEQLINEVNEMIDDMLANRTASGGDELVAMLASGLAARLPAGASTQAVNAILLEAERRDRIDGGGLSSNTWEELKERTQKERAEQAKMADFADDAMNGQLSTVPDKYGLSQQNYAELNDELKTRDGQERFMNFMRMLHPELSDAQIRERLTIADAITAERSGRGTAETRRVLETAPPSLVNDVSGDLAQYQEMDRSRIPTGPLINRVDGQMVDVVRDSASVDTAYGGRSNLLSGEAPAILPQPPSSPISIASSVDGQTGISALQPLRATFAAANAAAAPLDQPASPQVVASATPPAPLPAANAGLDV